MLSHEQRQALMRIARQSVEAAVGGQRPQRVTMDDPQLAEHCGAFVTFKTRGRLRGCIGQFIADRPLYEVVQKMAIAAATEDPRFLDDRIQPGEVAALEIEISVLSPLKRTSDPLSLELGKHGIYVRKGYRAGCFLPQVATETGWSKEEFLSQCCGGKAGLAPDAWRDPATEVYLFTAEIIEEDR
ncbi:MAG: AmmeMemoRadiSam system protein A [Planctomycetes bacterium]|nr:AmmeMemoRadiSam system protein A [Planctomycetota bacterium]